MFGKVTPLAFKTVPFPSFNVGGTNVESVRLTVVPEPVTFNISMPPTDAVYAADGV